MNVIRNVRRIVWLRIVFIAVFSTIPRSFEAHSLGFFRILLSTYLSSLALSILLFGFLGSFFYGSSIFTLINNILYT